jgi:WD40 repeat protein
VLATGSYDHLIRLWDPSNGKEKLPALTGHTQGVRRVRFSPDGKTLASTGWDRTVRLWDVEKHALLRTCQGHEDHVMAIDWAPDGTWLASGARDGTIRIWDPRTCRSLATLFTDEQHVYSLAVWGNGEGFTYGGTSLHAFAFAPLLSPGAQLTEVERRTGLTIDEEQLVAVPLGR